MGADAESATVVRAAHERAIRAQDLMNLFRQTDWTKGRDERSVSAMLSGSSISVAAWEAKRVVGYARAVSDGVYRAFVEDVIVDDRHRGTGLGRVLMERLLRELDGVQEVKLYCVPDLVPFYGKLGFLPAGLIGMERVTSPSP